jgi:hypothetical protein
MSTLSTVSVDFIANVSRFTEGLQKMAKSSKFFSAGLKKDASNAAADLQKIGKAAAAAGVALYAGVALGVAKSVKELIPFKGYDYSNDAINILVNNLISQTSLS